MKSKKSLERLLAQEYMVVLARTRSISDILVDASGTIIEPEYIKVGILALGTEDLLSYVVGMCRGYRDSVVSIRLAKPDDKYRSFRATPAVQRLHQIDEEEKTTRKGVNKKRGEMQ